MRNYISLLRGINVSGQKKVPMAELRALLQQKGLENLRTYIQSGNLVFTSGQDVDRLAELIKSAIEDHFGFEVPVLILTGDELERILRENPYHRQDAGKLYLTFLAQRPDPQLIESLASYTKPNEKFEIKGRVVYFYCPDGYGRTKFSNNFLEKKLRVTATTRNWKTCVTLSDMVANTS